MYNFWRWILNVDFDTEKKKQIQQKSSEFHTVSPSGRESSIS